MKRGEIWTVAGGVYASKPRPAIVVQEDRFDATESIVVIPLTTTKVNAPVERVMIPAGGVTGIGEPSFAMIDKITTVRRAKLGTSVGHVPNAVMVEIERSIVVFLGLAE